MNKLQLRLNSLTRQGVVRFLSGKLPCYIVCEFPKCGGSWLGQMLASALEVPFPRNRFPRLESSIMHGHFLNPWGMRNVVVLWRDPRDVAVSYYHHSFFENEYANSALVKLMRREFAFADYDDVAGNLPTFIRRIYERPIFPRYSYSEFVARWRPRQDVVQSSYEALRRDPAAELARVVEELTGRKLARSNIEGIVDRYSFENQTKRRPDEQNKRSFLRSGVAGAWVGTFTPEARRVMREVAQPDLEALGYETDDRWAEQDARAR